MDARTEDIGGEDDGVAGAGGAGDVGSEAPREVVDDLTSLAATQRQVRRVVEALGVLMSGRRGSEHGGGEAEEHLREAHGVRKAGHRSTS